MASRNPAPSFKTDVQRAKTKKWVEAKTYNYDGGDWGDEDDDDEDYNEPPPPQKPTGMRQRGQGSFPPGEVMQSIPSPAEQSMPSKTRQRPGSYEAGDERRDFVHPANRGPVDVRLDQPYAQRPNDYYGANNPGGELRLPQPSPWHGQTATLQALRSPSSQAAPQQRYPPSHANVRQGREAPQDRAAQGYFPGVADTRLPSSTSSTPSGGDIYRRRDFSPSAVPQPLSGRQGQGGPPPQEAASPSFRPPPRKESLTSLGRPSLGDRQPAEAMEPTEARPTSSESQSSSRMVRPSDIYARMEQEKDRVKRASMDSNRPSLETENRGPGRPYQAQAASTPYAQQPNEPVELDAGSRLNPSLDPVAERKSEYGFDGLMSTGPSANTSAASPLDLDAPSLPQLGRFSSFGTDLLNPAGFGVDASKGSNTTTTTSAPAASSAVTDTRQVASEDPSLHTQPSLGFRSAVEHAFEGDENPSASTLKSGLSSPRSIDDSNVSRSNTDSTAGISPIMSRVPSAGTALRRAQEREGYQTTTSPIPEESREAGSPDSRPTTSGTLRAGGQTDASLSKHSRNTSADSASTAVKPGFRREQNAPLSTNVPAHTPALETNRGLQRSDEAEIAMATPVDVNFHQAPGNLATRVVDSTVPDDSPTSNYSRRESDLAESARSEPSSAGIGKAAVAEQANFIQTHPKISSAVGADDNDAPPRPGSSPRPSSPSKGRVKDLATKYNEIHISRRSSNASPTSSISSWASSPRRMNSTGLDNAFPSDAGKSQPSELSEASDRSGQGLEPPSRPRLPGEWVSYANSVNSSRPDGSQEDGSSLAQNARDITSSRDATPRVASPATEDEVDLRPATQQRSLIGRTHDDQPNSPLAAVAAAGSAIAESLKQTVGMSQPERAENDIDDSDSSNDMITPDTRDRTVGETPRGTSDRRQEYFANQGASSTSQDHGTKTASTMKPILPHGMGVDNSPDVSETDSENEALRQDIVRNLTPQRPTPSPSRSPGLSVTSETKPSSQRLAESPIASPDYSSYWGGAVPKSESRPQSRRKSDDLGFAPDFGPTKFDGPYVPPGQAPSSSVRSQPMADGRPTLDKRFSWEQSNEAGPNVRTSDLASPGEGPSNLTQLSPSPMEYPDTTDRRMIESSLSSKALPDVSDTPFETPVQERDNLLAKSPTTTSGVRKISHGLPSSSIPAFKEILSQKNPTERIGAFDRARDHFATVDTGMSDWLTYMVKAHPEHLQSNTGAASRPMPNTALAGSARGRFPSNQQRGPGTQATAADSPSRTRGPAQIKSKELYQSAAMLSGRATSKATTGAKGLFAKGKSRFRNVSTEKVPPSQMSEKRGMRFGLRRRSQPDTAKALLETPPLMPQHSSSAIPGRDLQHLNETTGPDGKAMPQQLGPETAMPMAATAGFTREQAFDQASVQEAPHPSKQEQMGSYNPPTRPSLPRLSDNRRNQAQSKGDVVEDFRGVSSSSSSEDGNYGARGFGLWSDDAEAREDQYSQKHGEAGNDAERPHTIAATPAIALAEQQQYRPIEPENERIMQTQQEAQPGVATQSSSDRISHVSPPLETSAFQPEESSFPIEDISDSVVRPEEAFEEPAFIDRIPPNSNRDNPASLSPDLGSLQSEHHLREDAKARTADRRPLGSSNLVPAPSIGGLINLSLADTQPAVHALSGSDAQQSAPSQSQATPTVGAGGDHQTPEATELARLPRADSPTMLSNPAISSSTHLETEQSQPVHTPPDRPASRNRLSKRAPQPRSRPLSQSPKTADSETALKRRSSIFDAFFGRPDSPGRPTNKLSKTPQRGSTGRGQTSTSSTTRPHEPVPMPPPLQQRNNLPNTGGQSAKFTASGLPTPSFGDYAGYFNQPSGGMPGASGASTPGVSNAQNTPTPQRQPEPSNRSQPTLFTASGLPTPSFGDYAGYFSNPSGRTLGGSGTSTPGVMGAEKAFASQTQSEPANRGQHVQYLQDSNIFPTRPRPSQQQNLGDAQRSQRQTWHGDPRLYENGAPQSDSDLRYEDSPLPAPLKAQHPPQRPAPIQPLQPRHSRSGSTPQSVSQHQSDMARSQPSFTNPNMARDPSTASQPSYYSTQPPAQND
ncbi:MAG: hypothetical protein M1828_005545 [Chrysothrix sp. TS-e1954]|nr:MAG: hypothetical protein M1828_005545 [Chrysothrix sp. TS-e1954]